MSYQEIKKKKKRFEKKLKNREFIEKIIKKKNN